MTEQEIRKVSPPFNDLLVCKSMRFHIEGHFQCWSLQHGLYLSESTNDMMPMNVTESSQTFFMFCLLSCHRPNCFYLFYLPPLAPTLSSLNQAFHVAFLTFCNGKFQTHKSRKCSTMHSMCPLSSGVINFSNH